jgi:hypothetical protein
MSLKNARALNASIPIEDIAAPEIGNSSVVIGTHNTTSRSYYESNELTVLFCPAAKYQAKTISVNN